MTQSNQSKCLHLPGVSPARKKDGSAYYRSSITFQRRHISLGSFSSPKQAHQAYLEGKRVLSDVSLQILDYPKESMLGFQKWVSLLNFRDNDIYFHSPIYMGKKQFSYYLSPTLVLKFDMDDLFYYSSHGIMKRGNHYFVADYGLQVNILNRYGIRNYSVRNRDYRFINGDETDFRRQNIEIINPFYGVTKAQKNGQYRYTARIHIRGNYVIGTYETDLEAAIAYNKAVDILKQKGLEKNFPTNYIDQISPSLYADIYSRVQISKKIIDYSNV